jgi:hypothetical protein
MSGALGAGLPSIMRPALSFTVRKPAARMVFVGRHRQAPSLKKR